MALRLHITTVHDCSVRRLNKGSASIQVFLNEPFYGLLAHISDDRNARMCPKQENAALRYRGIKVIVDKPFKAGIHAIIDIVSWTTAVSGAWNSKSKQLAISGSMRVSRGMIA